MSTWIIDVDHDDADAEKFIIRAEIAITRKQASEFVQRQSAWTLLGSTDPELYGMLNRLLFNREYDDARVADIATELLATGIRNALPVFDAT